MADYAPPLAELAFTLESVVDASRLQDSGAFPDFDFETARAVLQEAGALAADVLAPLNVIGDRQPARLENGVVRTSPGFADAYAAFSAGGWAGISADADHGGQGLPHTMGICAQELWNGANMAFGLNPLLTQGAIEAISAHGTPAQKALYLPKLTSGAWTGTMNLTEPAAGSDVGALNAKAVPAGDGTYRITGQKIFITWGEHDVAENIVHLVLARLPGAPPGTRGISLFLVPKFIPHTDGSLGARNDLRCVGLEHKLGIHGSPTCTMSFGDDGGATGWLIGAENKGMAAMFTMMNSARLNVGTQGVGLAERATQQALAYARERRQGKPFGLQHEGAEMVPIIRHPDVRRMLMTMKAGTEAARAICLATAIAIDLARHHPDPAERAKAKAREELLTPLAKGWSTDMAVRTAGLGVQVHGGMGFIEETGAAQYYRDVRILPIYEGTNGIQAIDLVARKLPSQNGATLEALFTEIDSTATSLATASLYPPPRAGEGDREAVEGADAARGVSHGPLAPGAAASLAVTGRALASTLAATRQAAAWLTERLASHKPYDALAGATPFLDLLGTLTGAMFLGKGALAAARQLGRGEGDPAFLTDRIALARFFAENDLPRAAGNAHSITAGAETLYAAELG